MGPLDRLVVKESLTLRSQPFRARESWIGVALAVVADECEPVSELSVDKLFYFSYLFGIPSPDSGRSDHFARLKTVVMRDTDAVNADETAAKPDELEPFADQVGAKGLLASDLPGWNCRQLGEDCRYVGRDCRLLGTSLK